MKEAAFEMLFKKYYNEALLYVCALSHDRAVADDIVAEAFLRAFKSIDEEKAGFKYWLLKVCRNCYFDYLRKAKRLTPIDDNLQGDEAELVDDVIRNDEYRALYKAIYKLKDSYREAVMLFYFGGLSVAETASVLGITPENAKVQLFRARIKLKEILEAEHEF